MPTINDLRQQAATIKNATQVGENTATRVGTTFETIADLLEGMGGVTNLSTIDIANIDTLNTTGDMLVGTPNIYTITKTIGANTFKVGTLFQFANNGRYDVAQVIVSQFIIDSDGRIDTTSADQEVHIFYRLCKTMNGGSLPTPIGTWTTWTELGGSGGSGVTIDPYPTQNSGNAVSSGGVFERLQDVAPKVDISAIDDIDEYSDMLAGVSPFYEVTKTLSGNVFRIGTLMEFANQGRYILYQILATDYVLNDDGTLDTTTSENGGLKLIWRMKQFSGNPPAGVTIGVWSAWSYLSGGGVQPDNEDIDLNANDQLQFANKLYDASAFSGLGRVYLRKNIVTLNLTDKYFDGFVNNVLVEDVGTSSTPDEICFDTTRKMFVARVGALWYIDWSSDEDYNPISREVNWNYNGNFYRWNGEELAQWDKTINQLTQAMVNTANTIYHIQYDYDLNGQTLTIPDDCVLLFDGGSFSNGSISIKDCAIFDGKFSDVCIGLKGGKIKISDCDIKRTTSITGIRDACILLEDATKKADIEICGCTISNEIGSGASNVYGLAIKLIGQVETYFNIHDNYVYCNGSMTIETQPSGDNAITGMLSNNTIISDQTTYNMAVSFPDGKGEKLIENNIITGYIEVSQGLVIRGNKITGAGAEEVAIYSSATGTSDTSKAVIVENNVINGIFKMSGMSCNLQIVNNYIAGILWFANLKGAENKIAGNTIIKDRTYTLNGGSRQILYTSNGCSNLVFEDNTMFSDIEIRTGSIPASAGSVAPIWRRNKLHIAVTSGSAVTLNASGTIFCENEVHVTTLNLYYSSNYRLFAAGANLTGATLKDNVFIIGNLSSMLADTKIKYIFNPASYTVSGIIESGNRIQGWTDIVMGTTAERPNLTYYRGNYAYLDTTINLKIFWGSDNKWWGEDGNRAAARIGDTSSRPTGGDINVGFEYYDTDLGKFVYAEAINGNSVTWKEVGGLTFDTTPTAGSSNPVTSAGIKTALDAKANTSDVYTKVETYTKNEVNNLIVPANTTISVVSALPASGSANTIYRVPATNYYSDYGWDGTQFVLLATYNNAIDNAPKYGSHNLVESGGVWEELIYSKTSQQGEFSINTTFIKLVDGSTSGGAAYKSSNLYPLANVAYIQYAIWPGASTVAAVAFYSSNNRSSYISGIGGDGSQQYTGTITPDNVPTGAAYVAFSCMPSKGDSTFEFNYVKSVKDKVRELDEAIQALTS